MNKHYNYCSVNVRTNISDEISNSEYIVNFLSYEKGQAVGGIYCLERKVKT